MKVNNPNFKAGYTARMSDLSQEANPFAFEAFPRRMWALGFQYADAKKEESALNAEPLARVPAKPYEQGSNAYTKGLPIVDCPYGEGDAYGTPEERSTAAARLAWRNGWKAAEHFERQPPKHVDCSKRCVDALNPVPTEYSKGETQPMFEDKTKPDSHAGDVLNYQMVGRGFRKPLPVPMVYDYSKFALPKGFVTEQHHYKRVNELIEANNAEVERRRVAERKLAAIAELVATFDRDPNEP